MESKKFNLKINLEIYKLEPMETPNIPDSEKSCNLKKVCVILSSVAFSSFMGPCDHGIHVRITRVIPQNCSSIPSLRELLGVVTVLGAARRGGGVRAHEAPGPMKFA